MSKWIGLKGEVHLSSYAAPCNTALNIWRIYIFATSTNNHPQIRNRLRRHPTPTPPLQTLLVPPIAVAITITIPPILPRRKLPFHTLPHPPLLPPRNPPLHRPPRIPLPRNPQARRPTIPRLAMGMVLVASRLRLHQCLFLSRCQQ